MHAAVFWLFRCQIEVASRRHFSNVTEFMANSKVPKMLVGVIAQHRENNLDFQWLNALRPQVLFNYLVRQFAACSRLKYAIANDPQPFPKCLGCVIGKDER